MKMEIKLLRDGTSCLYENGEPIINLCFDKIERLSDKIEGSNGESNYYLLWQNDKCFYLYHTKKHIFVPTSSGVRTAKSFRVIENYSEETGSFAAYRSDNDLAYLIYEDGVASSDLFISIGAESEDEQRSRPVKYSCNGDRWCFFESKSKKMAWNKSFGYQFNDGLALYKRYQNNFFSVLNPNDKSLTLAYYDNKKRHPYTIKNSNGNIEIKKGNVHYFNGYSFKAIKRMGKYLICESRHDLYYVFDTTNKEINRHICVSNDCPKIYGSRLLLTSDGHWQIYNVKSQETVENQSWNKTCELILDKSYVFSQDPFGQQWKIYSIHDGNEVFTEWQIQSVVRNFNNSVELTVIASDGHRQKYNSGDVLQAHQEWREKMQKLIERNQQIITVIPIDKEQSLDVDIDTSIEAEIKSHSSHGVKESNCTISSFPDHIDFILAADAKITPSVPSIIRYDRKVPSDLTVNSIIFWYEESKNKVYLVQYRHKTYHIIYTRELNMEHDYVGLVPSTLTRCYVNNVSEDDFIDKVMASLSNAITTENIISIEHRYKTVFNFLSNQGFKNETIKESLRILIPEYIEKEKKIRELPRACFNFNGKDYSLRPDEIWSVEDPFRKKFLNKPEYIAILVDINYGFREGSEFPGAHYEMKGMGQDQRCDQSFDNPSRSLNENGLIRDNSKRILLFKKAKNKMLFFDEVTCLDYSIEKEYFGDSSRKVIKFYLRSLIRHH